MFSQTLPLYILFLLLAVNPSLQAPAITKTTTSPLSIKTSVPDCSIHGLATDALTSLILDTTSAASIEECQLDCMITSRCESYSYFPDPTTLKQNCVYYMTYIRNVAKYVTVDKDSLTVFSDKYPEDGSNFCFGNPSWGVGGKTISSTKTKTNSTVGPTSKPTATS